MRKRLLLLSFGFGLMLGTIPFASSARADEDRRAAESAQAYKDQVLPFLSRYCQGCHNPEKARGDFDLTIYEDQLAVLNDRERWELVAIYLEDGDMPPPGHDLRPDDSEVEAVVSWIDATLEDLNCQLVEPGRVTLRRLNRAEYANTIRDLIGIDFQATADFPADNVGYGFDNIGDVLTLDPLLMEKYLTAAQTIAEEAIHSGGPSAGEIKEWEGRELRRAGGERIGEGNGRYPDARKLASNGEIGLEHEFPADGRYFLRARVYGEQAGPDPVRMAFKLDGKTVEEVDVKVEERNTGTYEVTVDAKAGKRRIAVAFTNDYYQPDHKDEKLRGDRNLVVLKLGVQGPGVPSQSWETAKLDDKAGGRPHGSVRILASNGDITVEFDAPVDGEYLFRSRAFGQQAGPDKARMAFKVDGEKVQEVNVPAVENEPGTYEIRVPLKKGKRQLAVAFTNDYYNTDHKDKKLRGDRNLVVERIEALGPLDWYEKTLPESHRRILFKRPSSDKDREEVTKEVLRRFADRAFRRPVEDEVIDRLYRLTEMVRNDGGSFEEGIQLAMQAVLVSPNFLFRVEYGGAPNPDDPTGVQPLNDFELASRLSYFLWSSMPDEELFQAAREGKLQDKDELERQAVRMLKDPRAEALVANFAVQWLQIIKLEEIHFDPELFPSFDENLREAMAQETRRFFEAIMQEDRSILDFLDADFTFVNEVLAKHYGIEGVEGDEFRRVELEPGLHRGGILTQASVLTITSNPTRTSPVKRGRWILEQVLGTPPPEPPPDVPELEDTVAEPDGLTLREQFELHRSNEGCATCHRRMDPLGFGFENFDAIGAWRENDGPHKIDPSGELPGGITFAGPEELKLVLKDQSEQFARNLTEKLLTFALGRGLEVYDRCSVDEIVESLNQDNYRFGRLVAEIVRSDPFRLRKIEGSE